jgi:hypothetical protein
MSERKLAPSRLNQVDLVACLHASHEVSSRTAAMSDAFDMYHDRIADYRDQLKQRMWTVRPVWPWP